MAPSVDESQKFETVLSGSKATTNGYSGTENANGLEKTLEQPFKSKKPLELAGALESFKYFDVTPVIGREFPNANLADWLRATNSDDLIRDLAVTSKRIYSR